jgi:hypothetical protein
VIFPRRDPSLSPAELEALKKRLRGETGAGPGIGGGWQYGPQEGAGPGIGGGWQYGPQEGSGPPGDTLDTGGFSYGLPNPAEGVAGLVARREVTHGDFNRAAATIQATKSVWKGTPNWSYLTDGQTTALEEIAVKIARILHGEASHADHWDDIGGYADRGKRARRVKRGG